MTIKEPCERCGNTIPWADIDAYWENHGVCHDCQAESQMYEAIGRAVMSMPNTMQLSKLGKPYYRYDWRVVAFGSTPVIEHGDDLLELLKKALMKAT